MSKIASRFAVGLLLAPSALGLAGCAAPATGQELANDVRIPAIADGAGVGQRQHAVTVGDGPNQEQVLFINFDGATLTRAGNTGAQSSDNATQNRTWIPDTIAVGATLAFPAFDATPYAPTYDASSARAFITDLVRGWYAPYNVLVTTTRPASGRYTMMMVGGLAASVMNPAGSAVGVAPLDCGNDNQSNIGFAFARNLLPGGTSAASRQRSMRLIAQTIAHEAGHSFGLEHVDSNGLDIMEPAVDPNVMGFLSGANPLSDGGSSCGGGNSQDTSARLLTNLGPGSGNSGGGPVTPKPTVAWLAPKNGETVPRQFTIAVSAQVPSGSQATITKVELRQQGQLIGELAGPPYQESFSVPSSFPSSAQVELVAIAYDSAGGSAQATTTFTIQAGATQGAIGCLVDADCEAPLTCHAGSCAAAPTPKGCDPACGPGETCNDDGVCVDTTTSTPDAGETPTAGGGVQHPSPPREQGCSVSGRARPALTPILLLAGLLLLRRRTRRARG